MRLTYRNILACAISFMAAFLFFALYNQWIIFTVPTCGAQESYTHAIAKKNVTLTYFSNDKWHTETENLLWSSSQTESLTYLINTWLSLLDDAHITPKKIGLESALISGAATAYVSFDHTIFSKDDSIFKKWMLIEGLLKTINNAQLSLQHIQFLVHHQHMNDIHLDFSKPWPIAGFEK